MDPEKQNEINHNCHWKKNALKWFKFKIFFKLARKSHINLLGLIAIYPGKWCICMDEYIYDLIHKLNSLRAKWMMFPVFLFFFIFFFDSQVFWRREILVQSWWWGNRQNYVYMFFQTVRGLMGYRFGRCPIESLEPNFKCKVN